MRPYSSRADKRAAVEGRTSLGRKQAADGRTAGVAADNEALKTEYSRSSTRSKIRPDRSYDLLLVTRTPRSSILRNHMWRQE